ncbi:MAG: ribosome-associated translation inhibitor RaiA [Firmicutes bacterium]|nr:ribosome-associated translation inhibitor RaiA [Bacillota bacterium]
MRVIMKGKNLDITPALREYAQKKLSKLSKFFDEPREPLAEVVLGIERESHVAEITLQVGGLLIRGESKTPDMYASIDEATARIERQVRKYKTRFQRRNQGPGLGQLASDGGLAAAQNRQTESVPKVVRTKRFAIKPMSVEEAILQMELLGHDFFVFANAETEEANVVYRRRSGDYGLIEPHF